MCHGHLAQVVEGEAEGIEEKGHVNEFLRASADAEKALGENASGQK